MNKIEKIAKTITKNRKLTERQFRALFGVPINCVVEIFNYIQTNSNGVKEEHFLWTLYYLKVYPTENVAEVFIGKTAKTFKKWVNITLQLLNNNLPEVFFFFFFLCFIFIFIFFSYLG